MPGKTSHGRASRSVALGSGANVGQYSAMPLLEKPFYRYDLTVEIPATEAAVLVDALAGERISIKDRLGWETVKDQIERDQRLSIEVIADDAWPDFERDIQTLSVYLSEAISGREVHVAPGGEQPYLRGWIILGRRGETARIALALAWDDDANMLVDLGIDRADLEARQADLPAWVKDALGPELRAHPGSRPAAT